VPVAIISASALLCLAFYNRLAAIVSRLRGFQRERLQELERYADHVRTGQEDASSIRHHQRILEMLEIQTSRVYRRARMIRAALLCLLAAIGSLTICSLCLTLLTSVPSLERLAGLAAHGFFIVGMVLVFGAAFFGFREAWVALEPVHLESQSVTRIGEELDNELLKDASALPADGHDGVASKKG
jgi:hypothetical protein